MAEFRLDGQRLAYTTYGEGPRTTILLPGLLLSQAMQAPLAGTVLVLELTRHFDALMVPTLVAVIEATVVARRLGAQSIYSARLGDDPPTTVRAPASAAAVATLHALDDALPEELMQPPPG